LEGVQSTIDLAQEVAKGTPLTWAHSYFPALNGASAPASLKHLRPFTGTSTPSASAAARPMEDTAHPTIASVYVSAPGHIQVALSPAFVSARIRSFLAHGTFCSFLVPPFLLLFARLTCRGTRFVAASERTFADAQARGGRLLFAEYRQRDARGTSSARFCIASGR
jgi:hypothetical protein